MFAIKIQVNTLEVKIEFMKFQLRQVLIETI